MKPKNLQHSFCSVQQKSALWIQECAFHEQRSTCWDLIHLCSLFAQSRLLSCMELDFVNWVIILTVFHNNRLLQYQAAKWSITLINVYSPLLGSVFYLFKYYLFCCWVWSIFIGRKPAKILLYHFYLCFPLLQSFTASTPCFLKNDLTALFLSFVTSKIVIYLPPLWKCDYSDTFLSHICIFLNASHRPALSHLHN